jgi:TPR repeat protein
VRPATHLLPPIIVKRVVPVLLLLIVGQACTSKTDTRDESATFLAYRCAQGNSDACARQTAALRRGCKGGDGHACTLMGIKRKTGRDLSQDHALATGYFAQACQHGDAAGCWYLGGSHERGQGTPQSVPVAAEYYEKACSLGEPNGCYSLGLLAEHRKSSDRAEDLAQARAYYLRACRLQGKSDCPKAHRLAP